MAAICLRRPLPAGAPLQTALSGLIAGAAAAAAGLLLGQLASPDANDPGRKPCESCGGDGYVECMCARWNYASASGAPRPRCGQCHGSLRTRCPRCRGGGTGVPTMIRVPIPVRVKTPLDDYISKAAAALAVFLTTGIPRPGVAHRRPVRGLRFASPVPVLARRSSSSSARRRGVSLV